MCASADATLDVNLNLDESRYGELGAVSMRADSAAKETGYTCRLDTRKGQGMMLTRNGKKPNNCVHRDFSKGLPTRWDPKAAWRENLKNQCFIRDRAWTMFDGATDYNIKMDIVQNDDETATIQCSVDGKLLAWYTDPCPLTGGEYGLETSRNNANFDIKSYTDRSCNEVAVESKEAPSLADGLTLNGMGKTKQFWKSENSEENTVTHYYSGACNSHGGKNREAGAGVYGGSSSYGARGDALNVASLTPPQCVKDGFIEADVTLVNDYLNGPAGNYGAGSNGNVGLLMRVESDSLGKDHKYGVNYDSWGYLFQVDMQNGKVGVYRGNNGGDHNRNSIGGAYLTGRYGCKNCKCKSWDNCEQFTKPVIGSTHNLRLELSTTDNDRTHVKAYLNGTLVIDVVDEEHRRYKRWMGTAPSEDTNMCGDFGLATYDSDVVSYKIKDYTGYVAAPVGPIAEPVQVQLVINETPETFTEDKKAALESTIAADLGLSADEVTVTLASSTARRLAQQQSMMVIVTFKIKPSQAAATIAALESPAFTESTGATFLELTPTAGASEEFTTAVKTDIVAGEQKKALKAVGIESDRTYSPSASRACCASACTNAGCKTGCKHWVHSSSLNWLSANRPKLVKACKRHCTKAARRSDLFSTTKVAASQESACHSGCTQFEKCAY